MRDRWNRRSWVCFCFRILNVLFSFMQPGCKHSLSPSCHPFFQLQYPFFVEKKTLIEFCFRRLLWHWCTTFSLLNMSVAFPFCALQLMALSVHCRVAILLNKRCNVFSLCGPVGSRVLACNLEAYICIFLSLFLINFTLRLLFVLQTSCNWACLLSLGWVRVEKDQ